MFVKQEFRDFLASGVRMTESAARLVDHVPPRVLIQWVLSMPYRLRYLLAWNHELCRAVLGVYARAPLAFRRQRARRCYPRRPVLLCVPSSSGSAGGST